MTAGGDGDSDRARHGDDGHDESIADRDSAEVVPDEVIIPIEDHIDLHPFAPRDIRDVVSSYLDAALDAGFREVRLIHGRGVGVQRASIRALLSRHPSVLAFRDDDALRGGWGATIVTLTPKRD